MAEELNSIPPPQPSPGGRGSNREQRDGLSVAVIGGGYAGMSAAVALADCGIKVTVFESAQQLGGARARRDV